MEMLAREEILASLMTEDPFCAREDVKTLESKLHHEQLAQIEQDLRLHLHRRDLPCVLTSDLLIRNVPLRESLAPDIAIWPDQQALASEVDYKSLVLSEELCPALVLEVTSESTAAADRDVKYEIYQLAGIAEYWLYDPLGYAGGPPFQGWRLTSGVYVPIVGQVGSVAGTETLLYASTVLGTSWGLEHDTELRLRDPVQADWYRLTPEALDQAEAQVRQERVRAEQAEAQVRRERVRAEQAEAQIQQERTRRQQQEDLLQQEIQRLHAQLRERTDRD